MKKTILSIAVIAAAIFAASCQKDNLLENNASKENALVFTASIETGANTKTTVERIAGSPATYKTKWESTDQISINGVTYTATPDGTDATKATFAKDPDTQTDPTGTFKAYFPARMYSDSKAILPKTYDYEDGKYNMPMYAQSTTTSLSFRNLCGVLAITIKGTDFTSESSIEVSSDQQMNGAFSATPAGVLTFDPKETLTDADKKVTLTFTSAKAIDSNGTATFYIPVPENTHRPLTIKISGETNSETNSETMVTNKAGGVKVERNTVYPITFAIYTVTFDLNGITGTVPETKVAKGGKVTKPTDPTAANHTFAGWYKTKDATTGALSDPWDFDNGTVTADMTLYARWTRTLESIYSNSDIPKVTDNTAPDDAWENADGGKAFIAYSTGNTVLYLYKKLESDGAKQLSCRKTENFTKIGDDYVLFYELSGKQYGVFTLHMTDGKFTSVTYDGTGTTYEELTGTYAPTD